MWNRSISCCRLSYLIGPSLFLATVFVTSLSAAAADDARLWAAIKSGEAFAIIRHALAPGTGDPENFLVEDCSTQRNLSKEGRAQARKIDPPQDYVLAIPLVKDRGWKPGTLLRSHRWHRTQRLVAVLSEVVILTVTEGIRSKDYRVIDVLPADTKEVIGE